MKQKLRKLFDFQKFEQNEKLNKIIDEAHMADRGFTKLSDSELKQVAGGRGSISVNPEVRKKK